MDKIYPNIVDLSSYVYSYAQIAGGNMANSRYGAHLDPYLPRVENSILLGQSPSSNGSSRWKPRTTAVNLWKTF